MEIWRSYPKIYAIGHRINNGIFDGEVQIEEKLDASQYSFMLHEGRVLTRSRNQEIYKDGCQKMFTDAVAVAHSLKDKLHEGWLYRGEYFQKSKHNVLAYDRIPKNHIALFNVETAPETYLSYEEMAIEAERLSLEVVPLLYRGEINSREELMKFLDTVSILGGQKVEGVVIKNFNKFSPYGNVLMAKYVSEAFKEVHDKEWKTKKVAPKDIHIQLGEKYGGIARWNKAIQHLKESGEHEGDPRDIGKLMKEVHSDVFAECENEIKERLFQWAWPNVKRVLTRGLPEWYKEELMKEAFSE